jgi:hypothetical protein
VVKKYFVASSSLAPWTALIQRIRKDLNALTRLSWPVLTSLVKNKIFKADVVMHTYNPRTWEAEAGELEFEDSLVSHSETLCSKKLPQTKQQARE